MNLKKILKEVKKLWNWIWKSDSIWSWIVALILIFIIIKFIFFPSLSLIMGTSLPLAGVESSSMEHGIAENNHGKLTLCGEEYSEQEKQHFNFDEYWEICGDWYEKRGISKQTFSQFPMKDGFKKGDIIIVWGRFTPELGDIIIFKPNPESLAPRPIIHRIINIKEDKTLETKGDHNEKQLTSSNNVYQTDETNIKQEQIIGKAIIKIPYLGWPKIWATELLKAIFS